MTNCYIMVSYIPFLERSSTTPPDMKPPITSEKANEANQ